MSISYCLDLNLDHEVEFNVTTDNQTMYGAVGQLATGEIIIDPKAAQNEWTDTIVEYDLDSNMPFFRELEVLESDRKKWEVTEMAASHARLYSILTGCYAYYCKMKAKDTNKNVRENMQSGLDAFAKKRGFVTQSNTNDMNRVVKVVFGEDRRRVSAYSLALRVAFAYGVRAENLATWIKEKGGVEEVRKGASSKPGMPLKQRAAIAQQVVKSSALDTIKTDKMATLFSADDSDKMVVLVATYRATGELEIQGVVKTDSAVKAALAAYYSKNKEQIEADAKNAEIAARTPMTTAQSI